MTKSRETNHSFSSQEKVLPALELKDIHHHFRQGDEDVHVLKGVNLTVMPGELVALVGQSGAGKSTLLQIAGLLETPIRGEIFMQGEDATRARDERRTALRLKYAGFVYQSHHLQPEFSALENVMLPMIIAGVSKKEARTRAEVLLQTLQLAHRLKHRPLKLSGGEQQRVALARALANHPKILIADEPTGNLDPQTSDLVFEELERLTKHMGVAALIATHNMDLAEKMTRQVHLRGGVLV